MKRKINSFDYPFSVGSLVDIGKKRTSNQDAVILCPEAGFYAVSDGMGGLLYGGETSKMIQEGLPVFMPLALSTLFRNATPEHASQLLTNLVRNISDSIYDSGNTPSKANFGATLSGVWLINRHAVFVNLGDSRGYILPRYKRKIKQVTEDHNIAALLVRQGEIAKEEARFHPSSSVLTRFVGMNPPATPDVFIREVATGDKILLCSDGLHGMVDDPMLTSILRSSKNPMHVCERLITQANANGGRDNISAIYINICKKRRR